MRAGPKSHKKTKTRSWISFASTFAPQVRTELWGDGSAARIDRYCHSLLSPIGHHRKAYIQPSKGKRSKVKKRKRNQAGETQPERLVPPPPAVASFIDVGLSNITRKLQPGAIPCNSEAESEDDNNPAVQPSPYSVIFVARSGSPSAFFSHLPQMVAVASKQSQQGKEPTRLVGFSKACEERLSACLGVPRVTSVALRADDTVQSKALVDFVRARVPAVEVPWLDEIAKGKYHNTKINTIQAPIGKKRQKRD